MLSIPIRCKSSGAELGAVALPLFCVDHMRMSPATVNLETMKMHVGRKTGKPVTKLFIAGEAKTGLVPEDLTAPGTIVDVE